MIIMRMENKPGQVKKTDPYPNSTHRFITHNFMKFQTNLRSYA